MTTASQAKINKWIAIHFLLHQSDIAKNALNFRKILLLKYPIITETNIENVKTITLDFDLRYSL